MLRNRAAEEKTKQGDPCYNQARETIEFPCRMGEDTRTVLSFGGSGSSAKTKAMPCTTPRLPGVRRPFEVNFTESSLCLWQPLHIN
jgi:hypothetical protein